MTAKPEVILRYSLSLKHRDMKLVIYHQSERVTAESEIRPKTFTASNGVGIHSAQHVELRHEDIFLRGTFGTSDIGFSTRKFENMDYMNKFYARIPVAIDEWAKANGGVAERIIGGISDGEKVLLTYTLTKTTRRLTFDIHRQDSATIWMGDDDGNYHRFEASNGYEVISRSRMDIQTERIWLLGANWESEPRSGSMVFSNDEKRDAAFDNFVQAIDEWAAHNGGVARLLPTSADDR